MEIHLIDPRTDLRSETPPTHDYRVVFWRQRRASAGIAQERIMWEASENDVLDAQDVHEVIEWAEAEARKRSSVYTIFAKVDSGGRRELVWLAGINPVRPQSNFGRQHPADVTPVHD
jgi:hypothetical protein